MSINLLSELKNKVSGSLVKHAADFLGEDEAKTNLAADGIFSTIIASLIDKGATDQGLAGLSKMVKKANPDILENVDGIFTRSAQTINGLLNAGSRDLPLTLGNKSREAANLIAAESGIKKDSALKLMKLASPFVMGLVSKEATSNGSLDDNALMKMIAAQKSNISSILPAGMTDLLEFSSFGWKKDTAKVVDTQKEIKQKEKQEKLELKEKKTIAKIAKKETIEVERKIKQEKAAAMIKEEASAAGGGLLRWLLPLALVLALLGFLGFRSCSGNKVVGTIPPSIENVAKKATEATKAVATATEQTASVVTETVTNALGAVNDAALKALDGITFAAGSAGAQMMDFIKGGAKGDGKFRFKNLNFASGSATITADSGAEVDNLAAILKAYTDVKVSIEGYTDNKGNADSNLTLSQKRADAVKAKLESAGIDTNRVTAKGFGAANPVASNDTEEGRAENRRIEVVIVK